MKGTPFERWGGERFFVDLVDRFYDGVASDPVLRPLYPDDLTDSREHLTWFLIQYWGGPPLYRDERGHPRLRMRHAHLAIGEVEAAAWLTHMRAAVDASGLDADGRGELLDYLTAAAHSLVNVPG